MAHTKNAVSGFKNINYPADRMPQICQKVYLTHTPLGCGIKIIIQLSWEHLDGNKNTTVTRQFQKNGLTKQTLFRIVTGVLPWYPEWYLVRSGGTKLTEDIVMHRAHKGVVYDNKGVGGDPTRRGVLSDEHYNRSKHLIPYAANVIQLWGTQDVITQAELHEACTLR